MPFTHKITACLCSWGPQSGFIDISVIDTDGGGFDVPYIQTYFGPHADIGEYFVLVSCSEGSFEPLKFLVYYDRNLHGDGTLRCPYLVIKTVEGCAVNMIRSNYIAAAIAINEYGFFYRCGSITYLSYTF